MTFVHFGGRSRLSCDPDDVCFAVISGVVDSEDIPLNLSRELLQDSALIRKLKTVITNRLLRFLNDQVRKNPESYEKFFKDYGMFLKEGIVSNTEHMEKVWLSYSLLLKSL